MINLPINLDGIKAASDLVYPPGDYLLEVADVEESTTKKTGEPMIIIHNKIVCQPPDVDGDFVGKKLRGTYLLRDTTLPFFKRFIEACCGPVQLGNALDKTMLVGRQYVAKVSERNGFPNIDRERPMSEWAGGVPGQGAGAPVETAPATPLLAQVPQTAAAPPVQAAAAPAPAQQFTPEQIAAMQAQLNAQQAVAAAPAPEAAASPYAPPPPPPGTVPGQG